MRKMISFLAVASLAGLGLAGVSNGAPPDPPPPVVNVDSATCLTNGFALTGSFTVPAGMVVLGNMGFDQYGDWERAHTATGATLHSTETVSEWVRRTDYPRGNGLTTDTKTVDSTDVSTWTTQNHVPGWTAPTGPAWYSAWYEVTAQVKGRNLTGRIFSAFFCSGTPGPARPATLTWPTYVAEPGTGS